MKKWLFPWKTGRVLKFCIRYAFFNGRNGRFGWFRSLLWLKNAYLMQISAPGTRRTVPLYILTYKTSSFLTLIYGVLHGALPPLFFQGKKLVFGSLFQLLGTQQKWSRFWVRDDFRSRFWTRFSSVPGVLKSKKYPQKNRKVEKVEKTA